MRLVAKVMKVSARLGQRWAPFQRFRWCKGTAASTRATSAMAPRMIPMVARFEIALSGITSSNVGVERKQAGRFAALGTPGAVFDIGGHDVEMGPNLRGRDKLSEIERADDRSGIGA